MSPTGQLTEKEAKQERAKELADRQEALDKEMAELNAGVSGKGLRTFLGYSRGRNPQKIKYQGFDDSKPETLPTTLTEFMELTGIDKMKSAEGEAAIVQYLIDGFNSAAYTNASDPISDFVESGWSEDLQKQFRAVVRNYASATKLGLDDVVALVKPGFEKAHAASQSA